MIRLNVIFVYRCSYFVYHCSFSWIFEISLIYSFHIVTRLNDVIRLSLFVLLFVISLLIYHYSLFVIRYRYSVFIRDIVIRLHAYSLLYSFTHLYCVSFKYHYSFFIFVYKHYLVLMLVYSYSTSRG